MLFHCALLTVLKITPKNKYARAEKCGGLKRDPAFLAHKDDCREDDVQNEAV